MAALGEDTINRFSPYQSGTMGIDIQSEQRRDDSVLGQDGPLDGM